HDLVHLRTRLETFPTTVCEDGTDHDHVLNGAHLLCEELPGLFRRTAHEIPQWLTGVHQGGLHPEGSLVGVDQTRLFRQRRCLVLRRQRPGTAHVVRRWPPPTRPRPAHPRPCPGRSAPPCCLPGWPRPAPENRPGCGSATALFRWFRPGR